MNYFIYQSTLNNHGEAINPYRVMASSHSKKNAIKQFNLFKTLLPTGLQIENGIVETFLTDEFDNTLEVYHMQFSHFKNGVVTLQQKKRIFSNR